MEIINVKNIIGTWLFAQIFIATLIIIEDDNNSSKIGLIVDFGFLVLLIVIYFGLKLIGV